jgi:hypothetical protein
VLDLKRVDLVPVELKDRVLTPEVRNSAVVVEATEVARPVNPRIRLLLRVKFFYEYGDYA